jgi:uncharacterized protein (DUF2252 family)
VTSSSTPPKRRTRAARTAAGRTLRKKVPRSAHAPWTAPADRRDPLEILEELNRNRDPGLVAIRYHRMSISPFTFFRGAACVMASDLAGSPTSGLRAQLCGDAHLANFGVFATPERDTVFDANDFDETLPGPIEFDIKRLATSVVLAGRSLAHGEAAARKAARSAVRAYRVQMRQYADETYLDTWYAHIDLGSIPRTVNRAARNNLERTLRKARRRTGFYAFPHLVEQVRGESRIRDEPPLIVHDRATTLARARVVFDSYRDSLPPERRTLLDRYTPVDCARKVVGVGSVGTECWVLLLLGDPDVLDPLFLQLKEADASVWEPAAGASRFQNHAERVVVGQHLVQHASDAFLGWANGGARDFYVRQLRDMKLASELATLGARPFAGQAELCGTALARAHARSGDPATISGYLGAGTAFENSIARFGVGYADQSERDWRSLRKGLRRGHLVSVPSP